MHVLQDKEHEQTRDELKQRGILYFACVCMCEVHMNKNITSVGRTRYIGMCVDQLMNNIYRTFIYSFGSAHLLTALSLRHMNFN